MGRLPGKANGINGSEAPTLRRKPGRWQAGRRKPGRWQAGRRRIRRGLLAFFLTLLILSAACEDFRPSTIDLAVASHRYSILTWELGNLPDKWLRKLGNLWPGRAGLPREERVAQAREFFALGQDLGQLKYQLRLAQAVKPPAGVSPSEAADEAADEATPKGPSDGPQEALSQAQDLTGQIEENEERRQALRPQVEALIEGELAAVLTREGITAPWGVPFPPVDAVFGGPPSLLVVSPRDRIYRQHAILLRPGLDHQVREGIEERLFRSENLSALVENTGGLAVYPSVVLDTAGMNYALTVTAHEWLHHWLFFQPLGRNLHKSPELLTLNETTASIAGEELGDLTFTALTGEVVNRAPAAAPAESEFGVGFRGRIRIRGRIRNQSRSRTPDALILPTRCAKPADGPRNCWSRARLRKRRRIWKNAAKTFSPTDTTSAKSTRPTLPFTAPTPPAPARSVPLGSNCGNCAAAVIQ